MSYQLPVTSHQSFFSGRWLLAAGCFFLLLAAGCWLLAANSFAQNEFPDYQFQYEKYREEHDSYLDARNKYLEYETLTSKNEAVTATKQILIRRAQVLRAYFILLKRRLNTTPSVVTEEKTRLSGYLDEEIGWLDDHIEEIESLTNPPLTQLLEISKRLERKALEYRSQAYQTVSHILLGKSRAISSEQTAINVLLEEEVSESKDATAASSLKNWIAEAKNNAYWGSQAIERAEILVPGFDRLKRRTDELVKLLSKIQAELEAGKRLFEKGIEFQYEIINALKKD